MTKLDRLLLAGAAAFASLAVPSAAQAVTVVGPAKDAGMAACTNFTFSVTIIACAGGYGGNLSSPVTDTDQLAAIAALGGSGGTFVGPKLDNLSSDDGIINFSTQLYGLTVFGFHAGGAGDGDQGTFYFSFDAGAGAGVDVITITDRLNSNATGLSNAGLFKTGNPPPPPGANGPVPEPTTWAMMLAGFGMIGAAMRRRNKVSVKYAVA